MEGRLARVLLGAILLSYLVLSVPTAAARPPTTGTQISLLTGCSTSTAISFSVNTAFFIRHGWFSPGWSTQAEANQTAFMSSTTTFKLFIDGVSQKKRNDFTYDSTTDIKFKLFLTNFPNGMPTGTYTFRGEWYLDGFLVGGVPGTSVFQFACEHSVTFS